MRIYLTGFMASGKSTIGRQLARRLNFSFADLDEQIEKKYKTSIPLIFEKYDEPAFRKLEQEALHETARLNQTVIATGGGTPCFFNNMDWMNRQGLTIYIQMHPKSLTNRLLNAKKVRPLIRSKAPDEVLRFIEAKLAEREVFYQQASIIIKGENLNIEDLIQKITNHETF